MSLKTVGDIRERSRKLAKVLGLLTAVLGLGFLAWTQLSRGDGTSLIAMAVAVAALLGALACNQVGREGWSFALSGVTIAAVVAMFFLTLFPNVMPSSLDDAWSLTVTNASSSPYTLKIMTWCAAVATPLVLLYQAGPTGCSASGSVRSTSPTRTESRPMPSAPSGRPSPGGCFT